MGAAIDVSVVEVTTTVMVAVGAVDVELTCCSLVTVDMIVDVVVMDEVMVTLGVRDGPRIQLHARERADGDGVAKFFSLSVPTFLFPLFLESAFPCCLFDKIHIVLLLVSTQRYLSKDVNHTW